MYKGFATAKDILQRSHHLTIECKIMIKIDVNKFDGEKIRILKKAAEKYGLSYIAQKLDVEKNF